MPPCAVASRAVANVAGVSDAPWRGRRLHFVGIGGAGMSGLAAIARSLGAEVTGSDRAESSYLARLRDAGIEPVVGHDADALPAGDDVEVVVSTAIPAENPERAAARDRGLTELHRAQLLGQLAGLRRTIAVSGTHGKTTTTAMLVHALAACGMRPSFVVGGELDGPTGERTNAGWDDGEWLVVEADESDRSLLELAPEIAVLTNLELDHHSTYASMAELERTMRRFLAGPRDAVIWDRPELLALREPPVTPFEPADLQLGDGGSAFRCEGAEVTLRVPGAHNARNAAAALSAARLAGADVETAAQALGSFAGTGRRFELVGRTTSGAEVYDDYAHHPTEVAATLAAARTLRPRRVLAAFQPHLYSRTRALWREFGAALADADLAVVLEVYPARERAEEHPGVSGRLVAAATADAAEGRTVCWLPRVEQAADFLRSELRDGDLLLTLGAGDIDALARELVADG
jgi:UDP-N-acetylmuramate--alanine ligase